MVKHQVKKNMSGKLSRKLTFPVLMTVTAVFMVMLIIIIGYYQNSYREREISSQRAQMDRAVSAISMMQSTVENIAKQIVVSTAVQTDTNVPQPKNAKNYVSQTAVKNALRTYTYVMDYIQEIMIYTDSGRTYSSMQSKDEFYPNKEDWYKDFKADAKNKDFTDVHMSSPTQDGRSRKVISYILTYYSIENYPLELGDLIISLDYAYIENLASLDMSLLEGYAVYNEVGNSVMKRGNIGLDYETLSQSVDDKLIDDDRNIYLISRDLNHGWLMVAEISSQLMGENILVVELFLVFVFLLLLVLIASILSTRINKVVQPINRLSEAAAQFGRGKADVSVDVRTGDEVEVLANVFNKMVLDVQRYMAMSVEHEKTIHRSQVDQLLLQINPHFIYNTLNSIVYMAKIEGNAKIVEFTNAFISLLQGTLRVEHAVYTALEEELKNVENYLVLQKYRYMDIFDQKIECPEYLKHCMVPKVILQPIVENAIFHGIAPLDRRGMLHIIVTQKGENIEIIIADNGVGMSEEAAKDLLCTQKENVSGMRKIGIANVYRRIKEICGEEYGFTIESKVGEGTRIIMTLPMKEEQDE